MRKHFWTILAVGVLTAGISYLLAVWLAPWFNATNTRVRLRMEAPAETGLSICWDEKHSECLPLVPYLESEKRLAKTGEVASLWLGELPPRPVYVVSFVFKSAVHGAVFHGLDLDSTTNQYAVPPGVGVGQIRASGAEFQPQGISYQEKNGIFLVDSPAGGSFNLIRAIKPLLSEEKYLGVTTFKVWVLIFSIFLLLIIPVCCLPGAVKNLGSANKNTRQAGYPWWVYFLCLLAAGFMLYLVVNSPVGLNAFDPMDYLHLATGGGWFSEARLPGYPLFLGLVLRLSGYHLNAIVLAQALLWIGSTFFCVWMLRRWLHPLAAVLFVVLCLLSPAQIRYARWIMRESVFASLVLLGIAVLVAYYTSRKSYARIWLVFYALICAAAFLVRENGFLILAALLPFLLVEGIRRLQAAPFLRARLRAVFSLCFQHALPVLAVGMVYLGFSGFNYLHSGYFQVVYLQKMYQNLGRTIFAINFDSRSLLFPDPSMSEGVQSYLGWPLYSSFIMVRDQTPASDPMFVSFIPTLNRAMTDRGLALNPFRAASILDEIGKSSVRLLPWQGELAGLLREYKSLLTMNMAQSLLQNNSATIADKRGWLGQVSDQIKIEEPSADPGGIIAGYNTITQEYKWYFVVSILALLASFYILLYEDPIFLAPIAIYLVNSVFLILTSFVYYRFVTILDGLVILQIALGLSLWLHKRGFSMGRIKPGAEYAGGS